MRSDSSNRLDHGGRQGRDRRKVRSSRLARVLNQNVVHDDKAGHRLDDGNGAGNNTRVVSATSSQSTCCTVVLSSLLSLGYRSRGLESDPNHCTI